jgi:hypothetical protein
MSGRFEQADDLDLFRFTAHKNQKVVFRARNRSLGSPCDLLMSIQDTKGTVVAESDPTGPDEGAITNTFKESGEYYLLIEELNHHGGPGLAYHIDAFELQPGFELRLDTNDFSGRAGERVTLKVTAARRDYDGPINLSIDTTALLAEQATIPDKKSEGELKVKLPSDLEAGKLVHLKVLGKAKVGEHEQFATASTLPALRKLWPNLPNPPPELDNLVAIGVRASESATTPARTEENDAE